MISYDTFARAWRVGLLLSISAAIGVVGASAGTCGIGLILSTNTWCGLGYVWLFGVPLAMIAALILGPIGIVVYKWLGLGRWWQFLLGGTILAMPLWFELAEPFTSPRWSQSGLFDTLNYLGTGAIAGWVFWIFSRHRG